VSLLHVPYCHTHSCTFIPFALSPAVRRRRGEYPIRKIKCITKWTRTGQILYLAMPIAYFFPHVSQQKGGYIYSPGKGKTPTVAKQPISLGPTLMDTRPHTRPPRISIINNCLHVIIVLAGCGNHDYLCGWDGDHPCPHAPVEAIEPGWHPIRLSRLFVLCRCTCIQ